MNNVLPGWIDSFPATEEQAPPASNKLKGDILRWTALKSGSSNQSA